MNVGTKSYLWGLHQFFLHPFLMYFAFKKVHRRWPNWCETCAIIFHDIGYIGCAGIDVKGGEGHPYRGARLMKKWFGQRGWDLVVGHSANTAGKSGVGKSALYDPDKLYYVLLPLWLHWLLARLSGEYKEYQKNNPGGFNPRRHRDIICKRYAAVLAPPEMPSEGQKGIPVMQNSPRSTANRLNIRL